MSPRLAQVVPDAFRVTRLKVGRRYCVLGRLAGELGWKMQAVLERCEAKRKAEGAVYFDAKKAQLAKAAAAKESIPGDAILASGADGHLGFDIVTAWSLADRTAHGGFLAREAVSAAAYRRHFDHRWSASSGL